MNNLFKIMALAIVILFTGCEKEEEVKVDPIKYGTVVFNNTKSHEYDIRCTVQKGGKDTDEYVSLTVGAKTMMSQQLKEGDYRIFIIYLLDFKEYYYTIKDGQTITISM